MVTLPEELRFEFGKNWQRFLATVDEQRIHEARKSLQDYLGAKSLAGMRFLDMGCGSGLFSLAARQLGAAVHSVDFDPHSVAATAELKRRFFPDDINWDIETGSVLDTEYIRSLGAFDVVYCWGVLHHTGNLMMSLANIEIPVAQDGILFIAIYNDQGGKSRRWRWIKRSYVRSPRLGQWLILLAFVGWSTVKGFLLEALRFRNPLRQFLNYKKARGMSRWHDWVDWIGGYPFEVAKPEEIIHRLHARGFHLLRLKTCGGGLGCNEYVFRRLASVIH